VTTNSLGFAGTSFHKVFPLNMCAIRENFLYRVAAE
jgi:hypothetical protein